MDYQSALQTLRTARRIEAGKPIDRNTRLMQRGENVAVRLHSTDIVTFSPDGSVTLNTGGWKTITTKDRINKFSPYSVWSRKGCWHVGINGTDYVFADGITVMAGGEVNGALPQVAEKQQQETRKAAKHYAKGFVDRLYAGRISVPSAGDCMICTTKQREPGHITSHIEERYYVPSLLVNALAEFGASKACEQNAWAYMQWEPKIDTLEGALQYDLKPGPDNAFSTKRNDFIAQGIEKCVRRYVLRQLGIAT